MVNCIYLRTPQSTANIHDCVLCQLFMNTNLILSNHLLISWSGGGEY